MQLLDNGKPEKKLNYATIEHRHTYNVDGFIDVS